MTTSPSCLLCRIKRRDNGLDEALLTMLAFGALTGAEEREPGFSLQDDLLIWLCEACGSGFLAQGLMRKAEVLGDEI